MPDAAAVRRMFAAQALATGPAAASTLSVCGSRTAAPWRGLPLPSRHGFAAADVHAQGVAIMCRLVP